MRALLVLLCGCNAASSAPPAPAPADVPVALSSPAPKRPVPRVGDPAAAGRVIAAQGTRAPASA